MFDPVNFDLLLHQLVYGAAESKTTGRPNLDMSKHQYYHESWFTYKIAKRKFVSFNSIIERNLLIIHLVLRIRLFQHLDRRQISRDA